MSYCKEEGKDQVIFASKDDMVLPSKAIINLEEDEEDQQPGLILANGDINWDCPCLGGMATGPCGTEFRSAFSCFHYSQAEPKGSDCYDAFLTMQQCMGQYPELYPPAKEQVSEELDQLASASATEDDLAQIPGETPQLQTSEEEKS
ncbi:mitochondrial intermembrane space import and assembly protein 40-B [Aplysia californica]|uniref:Mitochondrial intermembrane space import and assembly protein 40-B n=1 Tax=Aplysia californica TaxID=6500 RepID=A0ABM0JJC3_APLCA|nr:mitochondrial intermembrane space import and assembly protein 40-B [Aplysia californica]